MNSAHELQRARARARLTQVELAARAGTSQATVSAYESGRKVPTLDTLSRLLAATGSRLKVEPGAPGPSEEEHVRTARALLDVMALAQALPSRHEPVLRYPQLEPAPAAT